jgi:hypothetical protein
LSSFPLDFSTHLERLLSSTLACLPSSALEHLPNSILELLPTSALEHLFHSVLELLHSSALELLPSSNSKLIQSSPPKPLPSSVVEYLPNSALEHISSFDLELQPPSMSRMSENVGAATLRASTACTGITLPYLTLPSSILEHLPSSVLERLHSSFLEFLLSSASELLPSSALELTASSAPGLLLSSAAEHLPSPASQHLPNSEKQFPTSMDCAHITVLTSCQWLEKHHILIFSLNTVSWDSAVGIATAGRPRGQSLSPSTVNNFLFSALSRPTLGPTQPPIQWVPGDLSQGLKQQGHEANHSPPASAEVKKM